MTDEPLYATVSQRAVLFDSDERILVVRRASDGGWELPGGRLDTDESTVGGLRREIREETGLDIAIRRPLYTTSWRNERGQGRYAVYYYCLVEAGDVVLSGEHVDYEWVSPSSAMARLSETQTKAVSRALEVREP